jgi:hypothetical protein
MALLAFTCSRASRNVMNPTVFFRKSSFWIFAGVFAFGLAWALYTQHAWEDYYITYRASKNLATGHGLTFTAGERVHSFTSPLGVLLPALASALTGNRSDDAALWIFRVFSLCAYAGAALVLRRLFQVLGLGGFAAGLIVVLVAVDTKIVDYSTNGQESGILVLFVAWTLYALMAAPPRQALHLGLAWAGLMWTRPDSCVYIAALGVGTLVFCPPLPVAGGRWRLLLTFAKAGVLTALLYAPWLLWTWSYYGTLVPHTITAKGLFHSPITLSSFASAVADFPRAVSAHGDMLAATFMPPYGTNTGWPVAMLKASYWIAVICLVLWIVPGIRREARLTSFAFFAGEFYLTTYVTFPVPWYLPILTVFCTVTIAGVIGQVSEHLGPNVAASRRWRRLAQTVGVALAVAALTVTILAAHQLKLQEAIIERGQREVIGRWLREHAASERDTVFLEPLGYIGFYSNLKMYDFPGLSSPEMVAARKRSTSRSYPDCWPALILDLSPNWLVLRTYEADTIRRLSPDLLTRRYELAKVFDVRPQVDAIPRIMGRGYLLNDAYFEVYHRRGNAHHDGVPVGRIALISVAEMKEKRMWSGDAYESGPNIVANAPSRLVVAKPAGARWLSFGIGFFEGAYNNPPNSTDGAEFVVRFVPADGTPPRELFRRFLNPRDVSADRGTHAFSIELPPAGRGDIEFVVSPGPHGSDAFDWAYWSTPMFEYPR